MTSLFEDDAAAPKRLFDNSSWCYSFQSSYTWEHIEDREVVLEVGGRRFKTTYDTLKESSFFESLLSSRWNNVRHDGSYFIDADPGLFHYILRYLRRGVFPLFYNRVLGHDYDRYNSLLAEAKYFGIKKLESWLEEKLYQLSVALRNTGEETVEFWHTDLTNSNRGIEYSNFFIPVQDLLFPTVMSVRSV